jgi:hypothetical protein
VIAKHFPGWAPAWVAHHRGVAVSIPAPATTLPVFLRKKRRFGSWGPDAARVDAGQFDGFSARRRRSISNR